ncbi:aldehyde dehydrogenase [Marinococcus halophilus]|uniref:Aldehyde dehydrogenase n=2 Tax=Marinococcus halophilus TaxID=1371 RepID=A0A510YA53_MARHA|nr:aldehyde dehydrogenase family protein [Marinococcus halophilus]OZT78992.1 aldehyde dehydrogenase [Marinococcus halophilus]GEK60023.1 aldehyde dehydrogenase [Marinococcus halophilus]
MKKGWFLLGKTQAAANYYQVFNPHTENLIGEAAESTPAEMHEAIKEANEAYEKMKTLTSNERAVILFRAAEILQNRKEDGARIISQEACKPVTAARTEVQRTIQTLQFSGEEAKRMNGEYIQLDAAEGGEGRDAYTIHEPIGVVGAITPFNFPLNLVTHKVGPAIAAGNTIVVKPAEQTPFSSLLLAEILTEAGLPSGAIAIVPGDGKSLGEVMLHDERVKKISFTGSPEIGKLLKAKAGLKKMTLELGSNSPMYIDQSCCEEINEVAEKAVKGAFAYNGQVCLSTQRIYVHAEVFQDFVRRCSEKTALLQFGDPLEESTEVSSLINKKSQQRLYEWVKEAETEGAEILAGGKKTGNGLEPTILLNVPSSSSISCKEAFGPVVIINKVQDSEEALEQMNNSRFGLNAGVFTNDLKQALDMAHRIEAGQVLVNDVPTLRFDHMPYGGVKDSGYGREGVKYAIEEMTELKMISLKYR